MAVNQKLRISLLGLMPLLAGACSGTIEGSGPGGMGLVGDPSATASGSMTSPDGMVLPGTGTPGTQTPGTTGTGTTTGTNGGDDTPPPALGGDDDMDDETGTEVDPDVLDALGQAKPLPLSLNGEPIYAHAVRLTHDQWERSVRDLLKLDAPTGQREGLTEDVVGVHDFANNELNLEVGAKLWADYELAAEELAAQVASSDTALGKIYSGTDAEGFIKTFGQRAFRRPLTDAEVASYQKLYDTGAGLSKGGATEFARGAGLVIEGMLQSPNFLYRSELVDSGSRLNGYEIAAKLSLLVLGTTPSDELLTAAGAGELDSDDGVKTTASAMIEDAETVEVMRAYHNGILSFNRFDNIQKSPDAVPDYDAELNADLKEAAFRYFDRIFTNSLGVKDILTGTTAYATPAMAELYGVNMTGTGMQEITLDADRPGYFTQLPFLILNSVNLVPDAIHRGVSINRELLCADVPPPTAANVALPARMEGQTSREVVEAGTGAGTCGANCHGVYINPLGFAFENFDGMGQIRTMDSGKPVDTSASYPFVEGAVEFTGAADLMQKLAEQSQAHSCYAKHLAGYFLQRDLVKSDQTLIDSLTQASETSGSSVKQLLLALVTSPAFTTRSSGDAQ